jgi:hypothetical protein
MEKSQIAEVCTCQGFEHIKPHIQMFPVDEFACHLYSIFLILSHMFGYLEQNLLGRSWKSLFFFQSNFFGSEKFQVSADVLPK